MRLNWKKEFVLKLAQTLVKSIKKLRLNKNLNWPSKPLQSVSIKEKILRKIKRFQKTLIKFMFKDEILNELDLRNCHKKRMLSLKRVLEDQKTI